MHSPIPGVKNRLNDNQKSRLRRGVLLPVLAFLAAIMLLLAGTYFTATRNVATPPANLDQNAPRP